MRWRRCGFQYILLPFIDCFALSFFGWFEITLPSSWSNSVDSKASATNGLLSIFLMAFTLTLVSFSCTGTDYWILVGRSNFHEEILRHLLSVCSVSHWHWRLPFTLFAICSHYMAEVSTEVGGQLDGIQSRVITQFYKLAFSLKFFL